VSLTDTLQAVFMIGALVVIPFLALSAEGGWDVVSAQVTAADAGFLDPWALGAGALLGLVAIGLGSPGNPHILVRYMSIDDERNLRFAALTGTLANVLMGAGAVFIGIVGRAHFPDVALLGGDTENLYPMLAAETLPPVLFGVVVASIFAAIMSTADSQLLVGASAVVRDLYEKGMRRDRPGRTGSWSRSPAGSWPPWCWRRSSWGGWRRTWSSGWSSSPGPASAPPWAPPSSSPSTGRGPPGPASWPGSSPGPASPWPGTTPRPQGPRLRARSRLPPRGVSSPSS
jgi:hypothetical protein